MEKLRQFIEDNRAVFDDEPLPEGHVERFEQKLAAASPTRGARRIRLWSKAVMAAAAIGLLLLWLRPMGETNHPQPETEEEPLSAMTREWQETQGFYQMRMADLTDRMDRLCKEKRTAGAEELLEAAWKIQTDTKRFEFEVVPTLPCDEMGLYAMTQAYTRSIGSLSFLLERMETL